MKTAILSALLIAPTPPTFLAFLYLVTFFYLHALLKEIYYAYAR